MSTRRPKVPQARTAGGGPAAGGGPSARNSAHPATRRAAVDPDIITATKDSGGTSAAHDAPAAASKSSTKPAAKPAAKSAAKPAAKSSTKPAAKSAAKPAPATKQPMAKAGAGDTEGWTSRFRRKPRKPASGTSPAAIESSDDLRPVPAKTFSGRLLVLAMVTAVVTVLLAPSVSTYLHQRSEIAALQADIAAQEQSAQELQSQLDRWADPNYIKQQARERIFLVMPGETRYLVKGEHGVETVEQQAQEEATDLQWVDALWDSVTRSAAAQ